MSTLSQGDTTVDISEDIFDTINVAPIVLEGVDDEFTDAVEIELTSTDGTSIRTETSGSTVLTGESLEGTAEEPASISLVTDGSQEAQLVAVNTANIANTVITTAESVDGSSVAAAQVVISSETVEAVSIKTASTEQKSQVRFDQTTETLVGVSIEMEGAGGNLDIQSASVDNLQVKAAGEQFSEISFGTEVETVSNAQIEIGQSGGSLEMEGGTLASSTIAIASDAGTVNSVTIASDVESVTDTVFELTQGSTNIGIASEILDSVTVVIDGEGGGNLNIQSATVDNLQVTASGNEFSEISFGTEVETVSSAQIAIGRSGGSLAMSGGALSSSTISIASDPGTNNAVEIGSEVASVTDTVFELTQGSTNIGIASETVESVTVVADSPEGTTLSVSSNSIDSLTFAAQRAESSLTLAPVATASSRSLAKTKRSSATIVDTTLSSAAKKNGVLSVDIDGVSADTTFFNERGGLIDASFSEKAFSPSFTNEGSKKARIEADFDKVAKDSQFVVEKGSVDSIFNHKVNGLDVDASSTKQAISLEFGKAVKDATISLGKGADIVIFGGAVKGDSSLDLGNDGKADMVTIDSPGKINTPLTISNVGGKDIFIYGGEDFLGSELSADSFENITLEFK